MDAKGPSQNEKRQQRFSIAYSIVAIVALVVIQSLFTGLLSENLPNSDVNRVVANGGVRDFVLEDRTITETLPAEGLDASHLWAKPRGRIVVE